MAFSRDAALPARALADTGRRQAIPASALHRPQKGLQRLWVGQPVALPRLDQAGFGLPDFDNN
jgi:hypothetical protein